MRRLASPILAVLVALPLTGCGSSGPSAATDTMVAEAGAGDWRSWVLTAPDQITVQPPPALGSPQSTAERSELLRLAGHRDQKTALAIRRWDQDPIARPWLELNSALLATVSPDPPAAARGQALLNVAIYDAVVSAWHWKYVYQRTPPTGVGGVSPPGPDPSYPSEHAVIAGAASRVLAYLNPQRPEALFDAVATEAANSRLLAGANFRSDTEQGLALGRAVAGAVIARARTDGSDRRWDGHRPPTGPAAWAPPGPNTPPVEPTAGTWRPWVIGSGDRWRAPRPPALGSEAFLADARQLIDIAGSLSQSQRGIATYWAGGSGTAGVPGIWESTMLDLVSRNHLSTPRAARVLALGDVAQADSMIAAWDSKYAYWSPRPVNAIRDLKLNPAFTPLAATPSYPGYTSGHAADSAAVSTVLEYLFPAETESLRTRAGESALSRQYAGVSFPSDVTAGVRLGLAVGQAVISRARQDRSGG